jgi:hypothetical protein
MKLYNVKRKPLDILSDLSETEVYCFSDPSELVSGPSELVSGPSELVSGKLTVILSNVNQNVP